MPKHSSCGTLPMYRPAAAFKTNLCEIFLLMSSTPI